MMLLTPDPSAAKLALDIAISKSETLSEVFAVVVAVGVIGEAFFGGRLLWQHSKMSKIVKEEERIMKETINSQEITIQQMIKDNQDTEKKIETAKNETAVLQAKAEQTHLEAERIKEQVSWRAFSPSVAEALIKRLALRPNDITIGYLSYDQESTNFAYQLSDIFRKANWTPHFQVRYSQSEPFWGIHVPNTDFLSGQDIQYVRDILREQNISFENSQPPMAVTESGPLGDRGVSIIIGAKKVSFLTSN